MMQIPSEINSKILIIFKYDTVKFLKTLYTVLHVIVRRKYSR